MAFYFCFGHHAIGEGGLQKRYHAIVEVGSDNQNWDITKSHVQARLRSYDMQPANGSLFPAGFTCADGVCIDDEGNIFAVWFEAGRVAKQLRLT